MGKARSSFHRKWRWQRVTKLMARDGTDCTICGEPLDRHIKDEFSPMYITFDHIVPRAFGGLDLLTNLRLAHATCNLQPAERS
jgi:5-methylcytosine-specific restriction endonuclease McrA